MQQENPETEVNIANKQNDDEKLNKVLITNTVFYILFFVVIGLPIWYLTTTTYRAALPYEFVDRTFESMQTARFRITIEVVDFVSRGESNPNLANLFSTDNSQFEISSRFRKPSSAELIAIEKTSSIEELDAKLHTPNIDTLRIFILDDQTAKKFDLSDSKDYLFLDNLYLNKAALEGDRLAKFIRTEFLGLTKLNKNYLDRLNEKALINERKLETDKTKANFDTDYEITFSLINEKPELIQDWNIESSINNYFKRLINPLSGYVNFSIKAQTLLYSDFRSYKFQEREDGGEKSYFIRTSDLSIMTNYIENKLGARVSDSSALEFVTYVPLRQPLYILADDQSTRTNAFLVPRWGGIYIDNTMASSAQTIRTDENMKVFMTHFLDLMGVRLNKNTRKFARTGIYSSEIYVYLLEKTLENVLNSINTLKSLSLLLNKISSMVIEDNIADHFKCSCEALDKSLKMLKEGKLEQAFEHSKIAYTNSEKVFFDKSLLEKLYFPEDQRFAIYIPLFIPVGIPLVLSVKYVRRWLKQSKIKSD